MKLQLALDLTTPEEALAMVAELADLIDIVEIGTPMLMRYGLATVETMKNAFPVSLCSPT